jgi:signal transduction histidine kinase
MTLHERTLHRLIWASAIVIVGGTALNIVLSLLATAGISDWGFGLMLLIFPAMGFFVVSRRPRNTLGWLMVSMGFVAALPFGGYGVFAISRGLPLGPLALALDSPTWVPFIAISGYLLLLFPDGHLPSRRWRWFAWGCGIALGLVVVFIWCYPGDLGEYGYPNVQNPMGIDALGSVLDAFGVVLVAAPLLVLGGAVGLIVRLRRTTDDVVRHQIRWLAYSAAVIGVLYALSFLPQAGNGEWTSWFQTVAVLSFALIPITIGIAILRYRLYDIDVVIRKTVVFATVAAFIALVYVAVVAGVGALVGAGNGPLLSAVAAAIVALVFQPVRARARRLADRLVYGKRATPYEVMSTFGDQLAGSYASEDVLPRMARVLADGVGAEHARVWLSVDDRLQVVAAWPTETPPEVPDDRVTDVHHHGELLGALSLAMPPSDRLDPTREALMDDLASQAGLVLRNVRLTAELRARLDELRAAQKRLVTAQDHERRKLERNIHDGAQQQLVALTVKLRLAQGLVAKDPGRAETMLVDLQADTTTALEDLRDLARGIYPPLLADKGLPAALEAQLRKSAVPATLEVDGVGRYPQEIEAAVYFSCLEALQNAAKYAAASCAAVVLRDDGAELEFIVTDDGSGFDPSTVTYGSGLQGIADRLGAIEGDLALESSPGNGTIVRGRVRSHVDHGRPANEDVMA